MKQFGLRAGAFYVAISIMMGAFGAHQLKATALPEHLADWRIGAEYLMYAGLGLFGMGLLAAKFTAVRGLRASIVLLAIGGVIFSSTLFAIGAQDALNTNLNWLGAITPIGGLCMILAWLVLGFNLNKTAMSSAKGRGRS